MNKKLRMETLKTIVSATQEGDFLASQRSTCMFQFRSHTRGSYVCLQWTLLPILCPFLWVENGFKGDHQGADLHNSTFEDPEGAIFPYLDDLLIRSISLQKGLGDIHLLPPGP